MAIPNLRKCFCSCLLREEEEEEEVWILFVLIDVRCFLNLIKPT